MATEAASMHDALVRSFERLYASFDGASFEDRGGYRLALWPGMPIPQLNGPWIGEDSDAVAAALPEAIAAVDALGLLPWVQTRSWQVRVPAAAQELGLTHAEIVPGMVLRPTELSDDVPEVEIALVTDDDVDETNAILASAFGAPQELFDRFAVGLRRVEGVRWYAAHKEGRIVSTAVGYVNGDAVGIFNVGTPAEHRGHGYGSALTARAVRDGFADGAAFAFLQSSDVGHGVYRRLGFRDVEEYTLLTRSLGH